MSNFTFLTKNYLAASTKNPYNIIGYSYTRDTNSYHLNFHISKGGPFEQQYFIARQI